MTNAEDLTEFKISHELGNSYIIICFSKLLEKMKNDIEPFRMSNVSESHIITGEYLKCLSEITLKLCILLLVKQPS